MRVILRVLWLKNENGQNRNGRMTNFYAENGGGDNSRIWGNLLKQTFLFFYYYYYYYSQRRTCKYTWVGHMYCARFDGFFVILKNDITPVSQTPYHR